MTSKRLKKAAVRVTYRKPWYGDIVFKNSVFKATITASRPWYEAYGCWPGFPPKRVTEQIKQL